MFIANFNRQPHKMVTIRRQQPTTCLWIFDHFVGLALEQLIVSSFIKESFMK